MDSEIAQEKVRLFLELLEKKNSNEAKAFVDNLEGWRQQKQRMKWDGKEQKKIFKKNVKIA